nr:protein kinase-like domain, phloem protein 2-like protein [Tanacetum cinerariifolium]
MTSFVTEFKHLEIQLEDIISATNNFDESKVIGRGGFGKVYKGELSHSQSGENSLVAIKRLDRRYGQGDTEFFKEIRMLSCYRHENLISLLGFCCQAGEMILIYEYASGGSLDRLLSSATLTWKQRLRICIQAAKGLSFLHDPNGTQQRVLHCDIKSANILLDENMTAKVSDFGLSKMGPANQQYSLLITAALGTPGYCDPVFMETYSLTKESDVYSFGIVLFEVLCGKVCVEYSKDQIDVIHVPSWKKKYQENKLDEIILQNLTQQMDPCSLKTFSGIAFQCLRKAREERPTMFRVVEELEIALESQEFPDLRLEMLRNYEYIFVAADPLLIYKTGNQLKELLSKGLIINERKKWLCVNEKGEHIERSYIQACVCHDFTVYEMLSYSNSRFPGGLFYDYNYEFKARVRGQYLTPQISYTVNLVFRYEDQSSNVNSYYPLRYKIDGEDETKVFIIYPSTHMREDGWFVAPFYQFTSQHTTVDLQFEFKDRPITLVVAGIEFQPSEEKVELPVFEEYQSIIKAASQSLFYTTLQELKQILLIGIYLKDYKTLFSLNEKGEHRHMISMEDCLIPNEDFTPRYESHWSSRFPASIYVTCGKGFKTHVKTELLSPLITYTVNLVFRCYPGEEYIDFKYSLKGETTFTVNLANKSEADLWFTAELYEFISDGNIVDKEIHFQDHGISILVHGISFEPLEKVEDQVSKDKVETQMPQLRDSNELIRGSSST